jgi:hypothetical protein
VDLQAIWKSSDAHLKRDALEGTGKRNLEKETQDQVSPMHSVSPMLASAGFLSSSIAREVLSF